MVLLYGFAASGSNPTVGDEVRERFGRIYSLIGDLSGANVTDVRRFVSSGMLITMLTAMQVVGEDAVELPWAQQILDSMPLQAPLRGPSSLPEQGPAQRNCGGSQ
ncbi:hypothetical protein BOX37_13350 [Nocardia mangyaensis]|uniref:Uncharacterized protein n=1 Tax=Nocardia mangyaensis TaxID=2213200 RepID=A0A1J0VS36_9NOCA|nr:hypothetical protein [Nocardia mangyaensis]APE34767.1 hypothetical protein BOX37_13350 [Nocardia mangyaensis]